MVHGENQRKMKIIGRAEHIAAAEGDAMRSTTHHSPGLDSISFLVVNLTLSARLCRKVQANMHSPRAPHQAYGPGYFCTDAQRDIGFAFVFPGASCVYASTAASMGR